MHLNLLSAILVTSKILKKEHTTLAYRCLVTLTNRLINRDVSWWSEELSNFRELVFR